MYGLETYSEVVAFLSGFDAATDGQFLEGFESWIIRNKLNSVESLGNLVWPFLALRAAYPDRPGQPLWSSLARTWDEHAVNVLWDCIEEFLDERDGLEFGHRERRVLDKFPMSFTASISRVDISLLAAAEDFVDALHAWRAYGPEPTVNSSRTESLMAHWNALKARDRVESTIGEFPGELRNQIRQYLAFLDGDYRSRTVPDNEEELRSYHPGDGSKNWWWNRIPAK
jgi:hypothetical protein